MLVTAHLPRTLCSHATALKGKREDSQTEEKGDFDSKNQKFFWCSRPCNYLFTLWDLSFVLLYTCIVDILLRLLPLAIVTKYYKAPQVIVISSVKPISSSISLSGFVQNKTLASLEQTDTRITIASKVV